MEQFDVLSRKIVVGDYVVVVRKNYRDMVLARVIGMTKMNVRVVYPSSMSSDLYPEIYLTPEVIKITEEEAMSFQSKNNVDLLFKQM